MFAKALAVVTMLMAGAAPAVAQSLDAQIAAARDAATRYSDIRVARRDGWKSFGGDEPLMGQHWHHPDGPDYVTGQAIDPRRPSNLMYSDIDGAQRLVALSYNVRIAPGDPLPAGFSGASDKWHVHDLSKAVEAATRDRPVLRWLGRGWLDREIAAKDGRTRLAMVHLWLIPNPAGPFASHNPALAYLDLGLPADWARDMAAARGVALAGRDGCDEALGGKLWIANVPRAALRRLEGVCMQLADYVRGGLAEPRDAFNARARGAWARMEAELKAVLTSEQKARIAAITEHGDHGSH